VRLPRAVRGGRLRGVAGAARRRRRAAPSGPALLRDPGGRPAPAVQGADAHTRTHPRTQTRTHAHARTDIFTHAPRTHPHIRTHDSSTHARPYIRTRTHARLLYLRERGRRNIWLRQCERARQKEERERACQHFITSISSHYIGVCLFFGTAPSSLPLCPRPPTPFSLSGHAREQLP
jgi:hypothetical protein